MKTMCPPSYHHNGFVATHALGHMIYIVTLYAFYMNVTKYKLNNKKLSRQNVCVCVYVCVCTVVLSFIRRRSVLEFSNRFSESFLI